MPLALATDLDYILECVDTSHLGAFSLYLPFASPVFFDNVDTLPSKVGPAQVKHNEKSLQSTRVPTL